MSISVLLVDGEELVRTGLRLVLDREPDIEVVGEAGDGTAAATLAHELAPDVVLMDTRMPDVDGLEATRWIVASTNSRVVILTTFDEDAFVYEALRAGASGFLLKYAPAADMLAAIRVVARGEAMLAPTVTRRLLARPGRRHGLRVGTHAPLTGTPRVLPRSVQSPGARATRVTVGADGPMNGFLYESLRLLLLSTSRPRPPIDGRGEHHRGGLSPRSLLWGRGSPTRATCSDAGYRLSRICVSTEP